MPSASASDDDSHLFQSRGMMDVLRNGDGGVRSTRASHSAAIGSIDPFRDFASESRTNAALATSATQRRGESLKTANARLSALFKPPDELIYVSEAGDSSFEAASEHALRAKKWLLVNVQQGDEFSSHQLNRDVWNAPAIHQLVQRHFVFCQPNHNSSSGLRYRSLYRPPSIPSVSIIDPITRQKMWDVHAEGGREIRVDKKLIRHIEHTLKEFAAKTDLAVHAPTPNGAAHMDEEQRMMQAAIDVRGSTWRGNARHGDAHACMEYVSHLECICSRCSFSQASLAQSPAASPSQLAAASSSAASNGRPRNLSSALTGTTKPATGRGRAASSPIQLDDDDDEDEVYVEINDSDGELDAAQIDSDSAYEDDEEVAVLPLAASSNKRKRAAHTTAAETIELDQEETKVCSRARAHRKTRADDMERAHAPIGSLSSDPCAVCRCPVEQAASPLCFHRYSRCRFPSFCPPFPTHSCRPGTCHRRACSRLRCVSSTRACGRHAECVSSSDSPARRSARTKAIRQDRPAQARLRVHAIAARTRDAIEE